MENKIEKTRQISNYEFFEILQYEFLSYFLRSKIYERDCDISFFTETCNKKREKIQKLCIANCTKTIFSCPDKKKKYIENFLNNGGLPNFQYRDDYQKRIKGYWDKIFYTKYKSIINEQLFNF